MILALECSTTSAKAMLFDPQSMEAVRVKSRAYPRQAASFGGVPGAQDTLSVIALAASLGKEVADGADVQALALGGTFHSLLLCSRDGVPLTPTFTWMYGGAQGLAARLRRDARYTLDYYQRTGCMVHALYPAFQLMQLRDEGFDFSKGRVFSQGGFLFYTLTGSHLETASTNSGGGLINIHEKTWDSQTLAEIGLPAGSQAPLATYLDSRPLSPAGAALLGLKSGIPVLPSYPDGALNQVGSGALDWGVMTFSMGTSAAIRLSVPSARLSQRPGTWCYLSPAAWLSGAATSGACNCVDWAKGLLFPAQSFADLEGMEADYEDMPHFLPFLFGERCPGWDDGKKGGFYGLSARHSPASMYFSVLEGVLFNVFQCYEILCAANTPPKKIKLSGGILHSPRWQQMCADIFGREISCEAVPHASLVGAAVLALEHTGRLGSIRDYRVKEGRPLKPDEKNAHLFARRYKGYLAHYAGG
ncbi:MAG: FGGY-family carbohydrate kinase [Spirochaetes bacterium]|nr:FGGY-family carbohydrate kinase [Spirochaetota bacterium]